MRREYIFEGAILVGKTARMLQHIAALKPGQKYFVANYETGGTLYIKNLRGYFNESGRHKIISTLRT